MHRTAPELLETLQKTQARQALILTLLRGQRKTSDPEVMMYTAAEMVGRFLEVDRVGFFEMYGGDFLGFTVGWTAGRLPLLEGRLPASIIGTAYLQEVLAGRTLGISDVRTDSLTADSQFLEIGTLSLIGVPIIRNGRWTAGFYVNHAEVRHWAAEDVEVVRDVGEQTWDAVERARAEDALRTSEERLLLSLEAAGGIGTWDWDLRTDRVYTNARFASLFSVDPKRAATGVPVSDFLNGIHPEDRTRVGESIQAAIESCGLFSEEYRILLNDGSVCWVHARGRSRCDEAGRAVRFPGVLVDITERKQIEVELRQQWHTFDTALSHIPDHVYIFDTEGRFRYANRKLLSSWKKTLPEAIGKSFLELGYPPELAQRFHAQIREIVATGKNIRDQTRLTRNGETHSFDYIFVPVFDDEGRVESIAGSTRDITERRAAEELVEQDRGRWRDLLGQVPAAMAILRGPEHRIEWLNDQCAHLSGRTAADLLGKTVFEALPELAGQPFLDLLDHVYRTGEPYRGHEALFRSDQGRGIMEDRYLNFVYLATRNVNGDIDGILAHIIDVTSMVNGRKHLEESEERFRQLADSMPQFVWTARADGCVDYFNERWFEFTGFLRSSMCDESWEPVLHPDDRQRCSDTWYRSVESGEPFQIEIRCWDRRGVRWRWFMSRAIAVRDGSGRIVKWFGTTIDIDEQKMSQEALLQTQKLESIGLLAGGIAHDFNNLLVGILGGASFALETIPSSHPAFPMLENVVEASERAAHLIRQMLAYSGKGRFIVEPVDLSALAKQTRQLIGASIPKSVEVRLELDDHLPTVETDPGQMQQVMMNLIINAAEAVGDANGCVIVRTRAETISSRAVRRGIDGTVLSPGVYAVLEVQDNGHGIDAETLSKIFDPFFTTKFTGRGLGLAAVSGVIRRHRGGMEVETEAGRGSTFRALLPASYENRPGPASSERGRPTQGKETILLIDDEALVRNVAKGALERAGYCAIVTPDGPAGLEHARINPDISLIVLDMSMPGMGGRQVMEALKRLRPQTPVLICSGYGGDEVHRQFVGMETAGILQKPFTANQLIAKIRSVLDAAALQRDLK